MRPEDWTNGVKEMTPLRAAFEGALMGDALAMPVHWNYDTEALKREYGTVDNYVAPKNPHSGSILWRSSYEPAPFTWLGSMKAISTRVWSRIPW